MVGARGARRHPVAELRPSCAPQATPPDFAFDETDPDTLVVHYRSARRLCVLAMGMIEGAAAHYGQRAEVAQTSCTLDGADHCVLSVSFAA
ncbi:heme NO-binding domain-containing protein [Nocardioides sp. MAHUQ-72]|uniref:heme NO-binding domain-containing protein n=1 Tax=unclassified Nocardioides TaxID=2615069 RepID=UPI0036192338